MPSPKGRKHCSQHTDTHNVMLIALLRQEGYDITCTDNAEQAISLAKTQPFDLFLVDTWLPDCSGVTLTKKIREFDNKTPVLFYSGAGYEADKQNARDAGAQGYVVKPSDPAELVSEVARLIAKPKAAPDFG